MATLGLSGPLLFCGIGPSIFLGLLAVPCAALALVLTSPVAHAQVPPAKLVGGRAMDYNDPSVVTVDGGFLYISRLDTVYKVNKLTMKVVGRAQLQ